MEVLEKQEVSFKKICNELDLREKKYLSWESNLLSIWEIWTKLKNRKGTFLTNK